MQPQEAWMIPTPPIPTQAEQEEAKRQAQASSQGSLDGAGDLAEVAADGGCGLIADAASACIEITATVASTSLEVIGGILGGLADL